MGFFGKSERIRTGHLDEAPSPWLFRPKNLAILLIAASILLIYFVNFNLFGLREVLGQRSTKFSYLIWDSGLMASPRGEPAANQENQYLVSKLNNIDRLAENFDLRLAARVLASRKSFQAGVRLKGEISRLSLTGSGTYHQWTVPNGLAHRWQVIFECGSVRKRVVQGFDGRHPFGSESRLIGAGDAGIGGRSGGLQTLDADLASDGAENRAVYSGHVSGGEWAILRGGGLPGLLEALAASGKIAGISPHMLPGGLEAFQVVVILGDAQVRPPAAELIEGKGRRERDEPIYGERAAGRLSEYRTEDILSTARARSADLPIRLGEGARVRIYFGLKDWFPYRLEFYEASPPTHEAVDSEGIGRWWKRIWPFRFGETTPADELLPSASGHSEDPTNLSVAFARQGEPRNWQPQRSNWQPQSNSKAHSSTRPGEPLTPGGAQPGEYAKRSPEANLRLPPGKLFLVVEFFQVVFGG